MTGRGWILIRTAGRRAVRGRVRLAGAVAGGLAGIVAVALGLWLAPGPGRAPEPAPAAVPVAWARPVVSPAGLVERSGVRVTQVAVTGGGGLVDLRFTVLDAGRAHALHEPVTPPAIVDERTGLVVHRLLMDHAHGGDYAVARTYYLVFENTGSWVRRGSKVTVLLGDAQLEHVVVA